MRLFIYVIKRLAFALFCLALVICLVICEGMIPQILASARADGGAMGADGSDGVDCADCADGTDSADGADCADFSALLSAKPIASAPKMSAASFCLINPDTGEMVIGENYDTRRKMASTTKIMTALIALESGRGDEIVSVSASSAGVEGSSVYLKAGERVKLYDLVCAMMLASANDAAEAIAVHISGSVEDFAALMNARAKEMGLINTSFENPHGLDGENHYTTARELAILAAYAMENKEFASVAAKKSHTFESSIGTRTVTNHNRLLSESNLGVCGVKTGFTKASGRCLVSAAQREGVRLVAVTLSAPDDWKDHRRALELGFSMYERAAVARASDTFIKIPVIGGGEIVCSPSSDLYAVFKKGEVVEIAFEYDRFLYNPGKIGDALGRALALGEGGRIVGSAELVRVK